MIVGAHSIIYSKMPARAKATARKGTSRRTVRAKPRRTRKG